MGTSSLAKSARGKKSLRKRESILSAAGACFAELGYKRATNGQIALRAGVSKGIVFDLFGDKETL